MSKQFKKEYVKLYRIYVGNVHKLDYKYRMIYKLGNEIHFGYGNKVRSQFYFGMIYPTQQTNYDQPD